MRSFLLVQILVVLKNTCFVSRMTVPTQDEQIAGNYFYSPKKYVTLKKYGTMFGIAPDMSPNVF